MTLETVAFTAIGLYIACGLVYSSSLRCWWCGRHDEIKMNVRGKIESHRMMVWHCRWCGHRRPAYYKTDGRETWSQFTSST